MNARSTPKSGSPAGFGSGGGAHSSGSTPLEHSTSASSSVTHPTLIQLSRPYLTASQIAHLARQTNNTDGARDNQSRFHAFQLIINTGEQLRFPIRTIGSAMILFQRFYLFNSLQDFPYVTDTALACLFVASKKEDTLKKMKDIVIAAYNVRYPNGPEISMDSPIIEDQRRKSLLLEQHVLETMSFDFRMRHPHPYIVKFSKHLKLNTEQAQLAWFVCFDSYKTLAPLKHTPHAIALASIYIATALLEGDIPNHKEQARTLMIDPNDCENIILELLELYIDWLPQTSLATRFPDIGRFMTMRIDVNKRLNDPANDEYRNPSARDYSNDSSDQTSNLPRMRDSSLGVRGTMRYVLDWERASAEGATI
ncbi:cyclin-like protein [Myxozyma melibiosi]|uniref:Cyclin-like protein n=1 Tax=Myxozyma melibiosi TaxID=54550 RepID=A0ABR1F742_9ASCO